MWMGNKQANERSEKKERKFKWIQEWIEFIAGSFFIKFFASNSSRRYCLFYEWRKRMCEGEKKHILMSSNEAGRGLTFPWMKIAAEDGINISIVNC